MKSSSHFPEWSDADSPHEDSESKMSLTSNGQGKSKVNNAYTPPSSVKESSANSVVVSSNIETASKLLRKEIKSFVKRAIGVVKERLSNDSPKSTSFAAEDKEFLEKIGDMHFLASFLDEKSAIDLVNFPQGDKGSDGNSTETCLLRGTYVSACFNYVLQCVAHDMAKQLSDIGKHIRLSEKAICSLVEKVAGCTDYHSCSSCGSALQWKLASPSGPLALHALQSKSTPGPLLSVKSNSNSRANSSNESSPGPIAKNRNYSIPTKSYIEFVNTLRSIHRKGGNASVTDHALKLIAPAGWQKDIVYSPVTLWNIPPKFQWLRLLMARDAWEMACSVGRGSVTRIHKSLYWNPKQEPFTSKVAEIRKLNQKRKTIKPTASAINWGAKEGFTTTNELKSIASPSSYFEIKQITARSHPCYESYGLFAKRSLGGSEDDLPVHFQTPKVRYTRMGLHLMDYTGVIRVLTTDQMEKELKSSYAYELFHFRDTRGNALSGHSNLYVIIDSEFVGNESRFINHYDKIAKEPNVTFAFYREPVSSELRVGVFLRKPIKAGEELLINYGETSRGLLDHTSEDTDSDDSDHQDIVDLSLEDSEDEVSGSIEPRINAKQVVPTIPLREGTTSATAVHDDNTHDDDDDNDDDGDGNDDDNDDVDEDHEDVGVGHAKNYINNLNSVGNEGDEDVLVVSDGETWDVERLNENSSSASAKLIEDTEDDPIMDMLADILHDVEEEQREWGSFIGHAVTETNSREDPTPTLKRVHLDSP